jgi:hypothetical protein
MTTFRIQELESLGFEGGSHTVAWEDRLSELAHYRKIHGHCNVPNRYSENPKLGTWVASQRKQYRLRLEGKRSQITPVRIKALESLGFEWKPSISRGKGTCQKASLDDDATRDREKPANYRQGADSQPETVPFNEMFRTTGYYHVGQT